MQYPGDTIVEREFILYSGFLFQILTFQNP